MDDDGQNQECKCYKVLSVKPIADNDHVFDMLATFLQSDRQRQQSAMSDDPVREKASWNELRRWANSLLTENDGGVGESDKNNKKRRRPIEDWVVDRGQYDDQEYEEELEEEQRRISEGIVKMESAETSNRSEVAIAGRSADESFVDHVSDEVADGSSSDAEQEQKKSETKEEKRARKKAKKEAKKEKRAKKQAKKEKKTSKKIKTEE